MIKITTYLATFLLWWPALLLANTIELTIHYVGPTEGQVWAGIQQGASEANLQGEFLGQKYTVKVISEEELATLESPTALLLNLPTESILKVAQTEQFKSVPVFNLSSDADSLRQACLPNLLNLPASQKMKQDALAQWQNKKPEVKVTALGWHKTFRKFAAAQLNKRFTRAHGVDMEEGAWSGWAALKLLSDTVARTQATDPATLLDFMEHKLAFDAQKGDGATFRDTGQLRQIVLLVDANDKIVAEAPLRGVKGGLDSLGLVSCK
jgi:hypothetical protein